jgi:hypothetical protein
MQQASEMTSCELRCIVHVREYNINYISQNHGKVVNLILGLAKRVFDTTR